MAAIETVWLAALTKDEDDAGSANQFNLTITVAGVDVFVHDFLLGGIVPAQGGAELHPGEAGLEQAQPLAPFDSEQLTNSSVRLGLRGSDAWGPRHVLVVGQAPPTTGPGRLLALAMETDIDSWLSADSGEGRLTMPVRRIEAGNSATIIRRVLLVAYTDSGSEADTGSDVRLQIAASGELMLDQKITVAFNQGRAYWHFIDLLQPFTRADVGSEGAILSILGADAWLPRTIFVFGLDTEEGRPTEVVTLSAVPGWNLGWLSTDPSEGEASVALPISN